MRQQRATTAGVEPPAETAPPPSGPARDTAARAVLRRGRARPLWFGHPWAYAGAIERLDGEAQAGDVVSVVDHEGHFIGRGFWNPRSQIPVRMLAHEDVPVGAAFFDARLAAARGLRERLGLPSPATTAYRLVNSEGDDLPGLVVDVFGDSAAFQMTTLGMALRRDLVVAALQRLLAPRTLFEVAGAGFSDVEGFVAHTQVASGELRPSVPCREDGIAIEAEPLGGQKTGLYLDQRPNRIRVGGLARGARVLDCHAHVGGFALQAARGGAAEVTAIDVSPRAVARIESNARQNGLDVRAVEADAFRFLETATPRSYDLVVLDPPKFARARKDLAAASKGYERLNALALTACAPGALLVTCSCSQNVSEVDFERIVAAGAKAAGRRVRVLERGGAGPDHPCPPAFEEGRYLKVLFLHVT